MNQRLRIAIIGSGIAGLSAAWALRHDHEVTLFERHAALGMDAFSIDIPGGTGQHRTKRVDVPMRVVYEAYYPNLTRLYREAGVELERLDYSGTFTHLGGPTYFSYRNFRVGPYALPMLWGWRALRPETVPIAADALRFFATVARDLRSGRAAGLTLDQYLRARRFSARFIDGFLLPTLAGICTCSYAAVRACPASVVLDYFARRLFGLPVKRVRHGTQDVVARLAVERPMVNEASIRGIARLDALHDMAGRCVWFAGAYASPGVPLLESAAISGLKVANRIRGLAA